MNKKTIIFTIIFIIAMLSCGCSSTTYDSISINSHNVITLTDEESEILEAMGDDIQKISADDYQTVISDINLHLHDHVGKVYQLDGSYTVQDMHGESTPYIINIIENDGEKSIIGLPLRYLEKEVAENTAIRVTAIIGEENHDGHTHAVLEVVAIESVR